MSVMIFSGIFPNGPTTWRLYKQPLRSDDGSLGISNSFTAELECYTTPTLLSALPNHDVCHLFQSHRGIAF